MIPSRSSLDQHAWSKSFLGPLWPAFGLVHEREAAPVFGSNKKRFLSQVCVIQYDSYCMTMRTQAFNGIKLKSVRMVT